MTPPVLYTNPWSDNCRKVDALLAEIDLEVDVRVVNLMKGGTRAPEFLAINPNGQLPALTDGPLRLFESNAVMVHLARRAGSPLWPADPDAQSEAMAWMMWQVGTLDPAKSKVVTQRVLMPIVGRAPDAAVVEAGLAAFATAAAVLDGWLADRDWLAGDAYSVADIAVGGALTYAEPAALPIADHPHLARWWARVNARRGFAASAPPPLPTPGSFAG